MSTLQAFYAWCMANKVAVGALLVATGHVCTILNSILPATKGPAWLHAVLGRLSSLDKEDGTLSIPLIQGNKKTIPPALPPAAVLLFLAACFSFASCAYCKSAVHAAEPRCVAIQKLETCGMDAVSLLPALMPFVLASNWDGLIAALEHSVAPEEGACILSVLEEMLAKAKGQSSPEFVSFAQKTDGWKLKKGLKH